MLPTAAAEATCRAKAGFEGPVLPRLPTLTRNSGQMPPFPGNSFFSSIIRMHKFFPIFLFTYMPPPTPPELPKSPAGIRLPDLENELFAASSH